MATTLTIGMAHHSDFDGAYFSLQAIRLYHPEILDRVELLLVDNSPGGEPGRILQELVNGRLKRFVRDARYIPMPGSGGTAQTRNRIFAEARTDAVLVMDCHVLVEPGALKRLLGYYDMHPECQDLLSGPLLTDEPNVAWTHFDNVWRGHMWGTWGIARCCPDCETVFSTVQNGDRVEYRRLHGDGSAVLTECDCEPFPRVAWVGHEQKLAERYPPLADTPDAEPFEIPAQGLGLFTCRKDAWLGFHLDFRGFGGEEFYIHEKFRQAGHRNLCLPWLRWLHRFARPAGVRYPLRIEDKVRNYILGHQELGLDLTRAHDHFVGNGMDEDTWQAILAEPVAFGQGGDHQGGGCGSCKKEIEALDLDETFDYYATKEGDFNQHFPKLRELAAQCQHVTEFGSRDYGVIPLLAGRPEVLRSFNTQADGAAFWKAEQLAKTLKIKVRITHEPPDLAEVEETDLLFYDPAVHTAERTMNDLSRVADRVRRYIVVHDTEVFGATGSDGGPGIKLGLIGFMQKRPEWTVVHATDAQYGLMVLSRNPADKPKRPSIIKMGPTFVKHLAEHVADGLKHVDTEEFQARLETCWLCDLRTANQQCSLCGCDLLEKAKWRSSRCDANKWGEVDAPEHSGVR